MSALHTATSLTLLAVTTLILILTPIFAAYERSRGVGLDLETDDLDSAIAKRDRRVYDSLRRLFGAGRRDGFAAVRKLHPDPPVDFLGGRDGGIAKSATRLTSLIASYLDIPLRVKRDTLFCVAPRAADDADARVRSVVILPQAGAFSSRQGDIFGDAVLQTGEHVLRNEVLRTMRMMYDSIVATLSAFAMEITSTGVAADGDAPRLDIESRARILLTHTALLEEHLLDAQSELVAACEQQRRRHRQHHSFQFHSVQGKSQLPRYEYGERRIPLERAREVPASADGVRPVYQRATASMPFLTQDDWASNATKPGAQASAILDLNTAATVTAADALTDAPAPLGA